MRISMRPYSDRALDTILSTCSFLATSASKDRALPPPARTSWATASASALLVRELTTTWAPSAASFNTVARPIFRPDPVTRATLPSSLPISATSWSFLHAAFRQQGEDYSTTAWGIPYGDVCHREA